MSICIELHQRRHFSAFVFRVFFWNGRRKDEVWKWNDPSYFTFTTLAVSALLFSKNICKQKAEGRPPPQQSTVIPPQPYHRNRELQYIEGYVTHSQCQCVTATHTTQRHSYSSIHLGLGKSSSTSQGAWLRLRIGRHAGFGQKTSTTTRREIQFQ